MEDSWTDDEYGASHKGAIKVLLDDGSTAKPVYFDVGSGSHVPSSSHWSVYDGRLPNTPRASAFRAACSCEWTGTIHTLDWDEIGDQPLHRAAARDADRCLTDWDQHIAEVGETTVAVPGRITDLLESLHTEIERYTKESPAGALKLARRMEISAADLGYWAAHKARDSMSREEVAAALGLNGGDATQLLARFGRWSPYV
ncbi:hypothetical protein [Streptomyces sp. NPDC059788]|uniref:hypothetical protein n=1 Tax=Streptomyces sp. NPDC059788 TaxID=3346948 RepID=UPI00364DC737